MKKKTKKKIITYIIWVLLLVVINLVAWVSNGFCDWYLKYIFPIWLNTYGRVTGLVSISVGEWLLVTGIVLVVALILVTLVVLVRAAIRRIVRKEQSLGKVTGVFYKVCLNITMAVLTIMTLNCVILYHGSTFSDNYYPGAELDHYDPEELLMVRNYVVQQCNYYAELMERDEAGYATYALNSGRGSESVQNQEDAQKLTLHQDMSDKCIVAMKKMGETYDRLSGYYPRPKEMFFSDIMCQQSMQGWYFPFSMEANINSVMCDLNKPYTICHELSHLKGYIYEDEANFIAYLACLESDDTFVTYSGYLSMFSYLENDVYKLYKTNREAFETAASTVGYAAVDERVYIDDTFVTKEEMDRINGKAVVDSETMTEATETFIEANQQANGISAGIMSYNNVVKLLMQYYYEDYAKAMASREKSSDE